MQLDIVDYFSIKGRQKYKIFIFSIQNEKYILSLQSDEVLKQAIGKDYHHGINGFHKNEFPTFSY